MLPDFVSSALWEPTPLAIWLGGTCLMGWVGWFLLWICPSTLTRGLSEVANDVAHIDSTGAGGFARISGDAWSRRVSGHLDSLALEGGGCCG